MRRDRGLLMLTSMSTRNLSRSAISTGGGGGDIRGFIRVAPLRSYRRVEGDASDFRQQTYSPKHYDRHRPFEDPRRRQEGHCQASDYYHALCPCCRAVDPSRVYVCLCSQAGESPRAGGWYARQLDRWLCELCCNIWVEANHRSLQKWLLVHLLGLPFGPRTCSHLADTLFVLAYTQSQPLRVKRLAPGAIVPTRGSASAAGFDLYASRPATVPARGKAMVDTDISIALPEGTYGRIAPRSGLGESWLRTLFSELPRCSG